MRRILIGLVTLVVCGTAASATAFGTRCPFPDSVDQDLPDLQTAVRYTVDVDGHISEAKISVSSGIADADQAAVQCVLGWSLGSDKAETAALQGTHETFVAWGPRPLRNGASVTAKIGKPHACWNVPIEAQKGATGKTTVGYQITTSGNTADPKILISSGNAALDRAALQCVQDWRYLSAMENGEPTAVDWKAEIVWNTDVRAIIKQMHSCAQSIPIDPAQLNGGDATSKLDIAVKGLAVESITIVHSSGSATLDRAAVVCAARPSGATGLERVIVLGKDFTRVPIQIMAKVNWRAVLDSRR